MPAVKGLMLLEELFLTTVSLEMPLLRQQGRIEPGEGQGILTPLASEIPAPKAE